jgi:hypothetical protein
MVSAGACTHDQGRQARSATTVPRQGSTIAPSPGVPADLQRTSPAILGKALEDAYRAAADRVPTSAEKAAFVQYFTQMELAQQLAARNGLPSFTPDPFTEARTWAQRQGASGASTTTRASRR